MFDIIFHIFNFIVAFCYFVIFLIILQGLIRARAFARNLLGTTTAGIFFTCSFGHIVHAITQHVPQDVASSVLQIVADGLTIIPAVTYLILRRRYGLIISGPDMISEFQAQIHRQEIEMDALRRLESMKDEFLAIASHELKTPLTVIKGYSQNLATRLKSNQDTTIGKALVAINDRVNMMNELINRLLDVSRIQVGRFDLNLEIVDAAALVRGVIDKLQVISADHKLILNISSEALPIQVDRIRMEQVIDNLVTNAIKYSPNADQVEISCYYANNNICIAVRDYGIGIDHEALTHLFERFYRSPKIEKSQSGLGLGLYISHQIIKACKGEIKVESNIDKGSTFIVLLPMAYLSSNLVNSNSKPLLA